MSLFANLLTIFRIIAIPFIIWGFFLADKFLGAQVAFILFMIASVTDYLDGKIARMFAAESRFGQMLDPIADKLLVATVLILLVYDRQPNGLPRADLIPVLIIICRELLVSGLREFLAGQGMAMPVTKLAKWKTTFQFAALCFLLAAPLFNGVVISGTLVECQPAGQVLLWVAAVMTFITGWQYFRHTCMEAFGGRKVFEIRVVDEENQRESR